MKQRLKDEIHRSWQINDIRLEKIEIFLGGLRHTSESPIMQVTIPQVEIPTELCRIVVKFFEFQLNSS